MKTEKDVTITIRQVVKIGPYQMYDIIPKYGAPRLLEGTELAVFYIPNNNLKTGRKRIND